MEAGQPPPSAEGAACGGPGWVKDVEQGGNISLDCFGEFLLSHSGGWQVGEGPGGGDKKAGDESTAVGIHRNLSGGSAVWDKRACCPGHPRGQITAPSACASSSFSTAPEGRSQVTSSGAPRATGGSERRHPGLVTDACRWATQVPLSVDTLLGPPTGF